MAGHTSSSSLSDTDARELRVPTSGVDNAAMIPEDGPSDANPPWLTGQHESDLDYLRQQPFSRTRPVLGTLRLLKAPPWDLQPIVLLIMLGCAVSICRATDRRQPVERGPRAGARAGRRQCRTAAVGCMGGRQARRRVTKMRSSTVATPARRSPDGVRSRRLYAPCESWPEARKSGSRLYVPDCVGPHPAPRAASFGLTAPTDAAASSPETRVRIRSLAKS